MVVPVGGHEEVPVNVRVVAATNRDLRQAVASGGFRKDLYYRLQVVSLATVALRDRPEDIGPLARYLLKQLALRECLPIHQLTPEAVERLEAYEWPGNVRQLENVLERAVLFSQDDPLDEDVILEVLSDQPESEPMADERDVRGEAALVPPAVSGLPRRDQAWPTLAQMEREHIQRTLERTRYNQSAAAKLLGVERHLLRRKMKKYGIAFHPADIDHEP